MKVKGMEVPGIIGVYNAEVYGLKESILASGYPMATETVNMDDYILSLLCDGTGEVVSAEMIRQYDDGSDGRLNEEVEESHMKRAGFLGNAKPGSGHDCYLKGVILQFDLQLPEYIWRQLDRYHFIDYVSSQSKMHKILELDVDSICNKYVSSTSIEQLEQLITFYNEFEDYKYMEYFTLRSGEKMKFTKDNLFKVIIANTPSGIMLTARMTTNYLQLKSMILQRELHKMQEWRYLCEWFRTLPLVNEKVMKKEDDRKKKEQEGKLPKGYEVYPTGTKVMIKDANIEGEVRGSFYITKQLVYLMSTYDGYKVECWNNVEQK